MSIESKSFSQRLCGLVILPALLAVFISGATAAEKQLSIAAAGAVGDGTTLNTAAIQKAIDQLAANGGGTLVIPAGEIFVRRDFSQARRQSASGQGAVLQGSTNIADYPELRRASRDIFRCGFRRWSTPSNVDHLRITGEGTIQGGGQPYWDAFWKPRARRTRMSRTSM
jgi:polygalacturonase